MKNFQKALLVSLLVFPGAGYFLVGKRTLGVICLSLVLVCLGVISVDVAHRTTGIAQAMMAGQVVSTDLSDLMTLIHSTPGYFPQKLVFTVSLSLGVIWASSSLHLYIMSRYSQN